MLARTREESGLLCLGDASGRFNSPGDMSSIENTAQDKMYANKWERTEPAAAPFFVANRKNVFYCFSDRCGL